MIAGVRGQVLALGPDGAVIELGGLAITVQCTPGTLARLRLGETGRLSTSLVVREDSLTLYGFADDDEREMFELLQTANGVGPRLAQAMLAIHPPREIRRAVATADIATLTRVSGVGRKGAEKLIVELRDRIGSLSDDVPGATPGPITPSAPWRDQLRQALVGLGWTAREADDAVTAVEPEAAADVELAVLLRSALRVLGNR
ncbi:MAG: Holliday junction branch migration protein RuvA [Geodermatophilaceae bacterium]|nr:Holliday junction branch migration protein RuvA [Geodermatophilaceae bacterium]MDQ3464865.1 Holliday junction branch migration protein RuvA [Actinomycetota bacterium]